MKSYPSKPPPISVADPDWQMHMTKQAGETVAFDPPIPCDAFGSVHIWSAELDQWVKPTLLNAKGGQTWATRKR